MTILLIEGEVALIDQGVDEQIKEVIFREFVTPAVQKSG